MLRNIFVWVAFALVAHAGAGAAQEAEQAKPKLIVVDPGHGGVDLGARSPKSVLEKSVSMKLALVIQSIAAKHEGLAVVLTRDGDLDRSWLRRLEFANAQKADLYISIHTGGGFSAKSRPVEIFIPANNNGKAEPGAWDKLNLPHKVANMRLAKLISAQLAPVLPGKEIKIIQSDKLTLEGLAMPAVLIEPVDLSNPQDEIVLDEAGRMEKIAGAIASAMINFLGVKERRNPAE